MWERIPWVCLSIVSVFTTTGLGVDNGICSYRKWERPGDVKFLVIAGIRENWNGACGNTSRSIFEQVVALEWILSLLGGNGSTFDSYIPGVTIGKYASSLHVTLYYIRSDTYITLYAYLVRSYPLCDNEQVPIYIGSGWEPE